MKIFKFKPDEKEKKEIIQFKINKYITLKLIDDKTVIYLKGERFIQCIRLVLNIPYNQVRVFDKIDSIDDAEIEYKNHLYNNKIILARNATMDRDQNHNISPKEEFRGHCSNLQAWAENRYDTRILHRTISFPLLKKLADAGDKLAKKIFKDEVAYRFSGENPNVRLFLAAQGFLNSFTKEEVDTLLDGLDESTISELIEYLPHYKPTINQIKKILMLGIYNSGKTSFSKVLKYKNLENVKDLPPTHWREIHKFYFNETEFYLWDVGGNLYALNRCLDEKNYCFYGLNELIYVIDVQDTDYLTQSLNYLTEVVKKLREMRHELDGEFRLFIFLHKLDEELLKNRLIIKNLKYLEKKLKEIKTRYDFEIFRTSIYNFRETNYTLLSKDISSFGLFLGNLFS